MIQRNVLSVFNALAAANTTPLALGDLVNYFPQIGDDKWIIVDKV